MVTKPENPNLFAVGHPGANRTLAYSDIGDKHSDEILICIPGLLETRDTFAPLLEKIKTSFICRAISVDLCGRGDSQPLSQSDVYSMKLYLSDLELFLSHIKETHLSKPVKIHLLGTSMGGILAMYLAAARHNEVSSVILNDVGFSLAWWSIYKLYGTMSKGALKTAASLDISHIASSLSVSPEVIRAVQDPAHFDLPFKSDLMGMRFANVVFEFKGSISLIHAQDSVICTAIQVDEFLKLYPPSNLLEVPNVGHPAPYNDLVCDFVMSKLTKTPASVKSLPKAAPNLTPPVRLELIQKTKEASVAQREEDSKAKAELAAKPELVEQLPLFKSLAVYPVAASEAAQKLVDINTQILDQLEYIQPAKVANTTAEGAASVVPTTNDPGVVVSKLNQSLLNKWRAAVTGLFRPKE